MQQSLYQLNYLSRAMNLQRSSDNEEDTVGVRRIENNLPETVIVTPNRRGDSYARSGNLCGSTTPSEVQRIRERLLRTQRTPRPSTISSFNRRQKLALISLSLVDFVSFCSMSIMAPFFPREVTAGSACGYLHRNSQQLLLELIFT